MKYFDSFEDAQNLYVISEEVNGITLEEYLQSHENLQEAEVLLIIQQIVEAVKVLQENKVSHRNIRPENIVIDSDNQVKLDNFELSKFLPSELNLK